MTKVFDKAQWHIDAGENLDEVIRKFKDVLNFLNDQALLSVDGKEILEIGVDSSVSLNENMVTEKGAEFLGKHYDSVINLNADSIKQGLTKEYEIFVNK